jgi:hypothetical protein
VGERGHWRVPSHSSQLVESFHPEGIDRETKGSEGPKLVLSFGPFFDGFCPFFFLKNEPLSYFSSLFETSCSCQLGLWVEKIKI